MIVVYGTVCLDRIRRVDKLPEKGGYEDIVCEKELLGGEAANTALALSRWGAAVKLFGNPVGSGLMGQRLAAMIREQGLGESDPGDGTYDAPFCDIYVTPDGQRTMFGVGFREMEVRAKPRLAPYIPGAWFSADPNHGAASREAVSLAQSAGMKLYFQDFCLETDVIPPGSFWQSSTDWVGSRGNMQKNVEWVRQWATRHGCTAIVSDGPNGFCLSSPDGEARSYPPYPCPDLVDSTGAGDVFRAGMIYGLEQGWELPDCLSFASAAGCLNCLGFGATAQVPSHSEIVSHVKENMSVTKQYS